MNWSALEYVATVEYTWARTAAGGTMSVANARKYALHVLDRMSSRCRGGSLRMEQWIAANLSA